MINELVYYDEITQSLSRAVFHADANLKNVIGLLKMAICDDMWQRRRVGVTGEIVEFATFEQFVVSNPPEGLGTDTRTLKWLCMSDKELLSLIDKATKTKIAKTSKSQVVPTKMKRHSKEWTLQKLALAQRPDLVKKLKGGKLTAYAVQIEMGWRKKRGKVKESKPISNVITEASSDLTK